MDSTISRVRHGLAYGWHSFRQFCRWVLLGILAGVVVGVAGAVFHHLDELAAHTRMAHGWLLFLLPFAGLAIAGLYHICGIDNDRGTNFALVAVRENKGMALRTAPLIAAATVLTHLTGGSSGREGAALQLGSSIASFIGRRLRLDEREARIMTMCGMAAGFSALFGTPIASAVFAMEVVSVGVMYYAALAPCMVAALTAQQVALRLGGEATCFVLPEVPAVSWQTLVSTLLLGCLIGMLAWVECIVMAAVHHRYHKLFPNHFLCAFVGGCAVIVVTLLLGTRDYNGAGMDVIRRATLGEALPWAFLCKLLLTALTLGAGFKGGEIVPTFFIGATFGCTVGGLLGLPAGFAAALAMVGLFCGVTNSPLTSVLLAYELFGGEALPLFALVCAVAYRLSGYESLYREQRIVYSKEVTILHSREIQETEQQEHKPAERPHASEAAESGAAEAHTEAAAQ